MSTTELRKMSSKASSAGHPRYKDMIKEAVADMKKKDGKKSCSRQAIINFIKKKDNVSEDCEKYIKQALVKAVEDGEIIQISGKGASGSFKLPKTEKKSSVKKQKATDGKKKEKKKKKKKTDTKTKDSKMKKSVTFNKTSATTSKSKKSSAKSSKKKGSLKNKDEGKKMTVKASKVKPKKKDKAGKKEKKVPGKKVKGKGSSKVQKTKTK